MINGQQTRLPANQREADFHKPGVAVAAGKPRSIVLLSGGMDSCVCAALAAREGHAAALPISYGQTTEERERRAFERICDRLGLALRPALRNESLSIVGGSALTDPSIPVPEALEQIGA